MKKRHFTKYLKRIILGLLSLLFIVIILPISYITYQGYVEFSLAIQDYPLEKYVADIKSKPNYIEINNISEDLLNATVAIEDRRFYNHNGIDLIGIGRAAISIVITKEIVGGGSTITQQLAKNMYFPLDLTLERKVSEAFMARALEKTYSKDEILELYVNIINYGDNHIGIAQASQGYFQKKPSELTLDEASLIAGLPQSPSNFQLSNHMDAARNRQTQVLDAMVKEDYITQSQFNILINQ